MLQLILILIVSAIFSLCESAAILEKINKKCSIRDDECLQAFHRSLLNEISDNGIPEMGVPKIDPMAVKDREIAVLGMIKFTIKEGEAKGFKDCHATSYKSDFENQRVAIDFVCDHFSFEGSYKIESNPSLLALTGGINIHGEGNGGIVIGAVVVNIFNENWKSITNTFGKTVLDTCMDLFFTRSNVFFEKTPAKNWITEDLSSYVKS